MHPFAANVYNTPNGPRQALHMSVDDRMRIVKRADAATLRAILALPVGSVQKTVRMAAKRRLRRLGGDA